MRQWFGNVKRKPAKKRNGKTQKPKGSKMADRTKINVKCHNCGNEDNVVAETARFIASSLKCTRCGNEAETTLETLDEKPVGMTFMEAVEAIKAGKRVRRRSWHQKDYMNAETCQGDYLMKAAYGVEKYVLSFRDIEATDWEIVK